MTTEEKAKAYDEALEWMREIYPTMEGFVKEDAEHYFPELKESEDERIREFLIDLLNHGTWKKDWPFSPAECVAWLKKQKEQKPEHFDLKAGKWYICHRAFCCRADHLTVKEGERFMCEKDGIVKGFVIKEPEKYFKECSAPAPMEDEQKEQKPVEIHIDNPNIEKFDPDMKITISDSSADGDELLYVCNKSYKIDYRDGKRDAEQKPVKYLDKDKVYAIMNKLTELSTSDLIPIESEEYVKIHEITSDVCSLLNYPIEQKPAEWSEEDEDRIRQIERIAQAAGCTQKLQEEIHDWLKSLRPSWKPSKEQMEALNILNCHGDFSYVGQQNQLISLYNDLKKLM